MKNSGISTVLGLILFAACAAASYYIVNNVWKPQVDESTRLLYIGGGALGGFIILTIAGSILGGRKSKDHLAKARQALADKDPVTASETVFPYLRRSLGEDSKAARDTFDILEEAYQTAEVEAEIDTLRDLHRQMCEIAAEHQGANGLIKDTEANAAFNQLNAQAEAVIQSFPRLG